MREFKVHHDCVVVVVVVVVVEDDCQKCQEMLSESKDNGDNGA